MFRRRRLVTSLAGAVAVWCTATAPAASASNWLDTAATGSTGEAQAQGLPAAPTGAASSCQSSTVSKVTVAWNTVTHATAYSVFQSTTSSTSGFSLAASGISTSPWTSGNLSSGNYWFKVTATEGSNWSSGQSSSTIEATVVKNTSCTID